MKKARMITAKTISVNLGMKQKNSNSPEAQASGYHGRKPMVVYFIGIAGKAMAPLAKAFVNMGWQVSGSDQVKVYPPVSTYLEESNIPYFRGYDEKNLPADADLIVVSYGALLTAKENPEYLKAKSLDLRIMSYPEVLREFLIRENSVVVAGTYGKTTISALVAWILTQAKFNPSYMTGGIPINLSDGLKITDSSWSVVEGDEVPALHKTDPPKFMFYDPKFLLITSTIHDHPEIYKTKDNYLEAFINLVKLLPEDGLLVYNKDNVAKSVIGCFSGKKVSYSFANPEADFFTEDYSPKAENSNFVVRSKTKKYSFQTNLIGSHNIENICAAVALCGQLKVKEEDIVSSIASFRGVKTRLEFLGEFGKRFLYWDFSQHPQKVKSALEALKNHYQGSRLVCVFDPQMTGLKYKESLEWYPGAFDLADKVVVSRVGFLKDNDRENRVSGSDIVQAIAKTQINVTYQPIDEKIIEWLLNNSKEGDVIVFMSSGGLDFVNLIKEVKKQLGRLGLLGIFGDKLKRNVSLADYTSFKIGGPADLFIEAETEEELVRVIRVVRPSFAKATAGKEVGIPYFILGAGSNILIGDKGFRGIVIKVQDTKCKVQSCDGKVKVYAESGVPVSVLLNELAKNSLTGLEFMAGIPGTVGGAVRGNAGAWQRSIEEKVSRIKILTGEGNIEWLNKNDCQFGYRESRFKHSNEVILAVEFKMDKGDKKEIEGKVNEFLTKRATQPKEPSAGCIFVNPKPRSAGELIESCGFKGTKIGNAKISERHANFIVNIGGAKAADVVSLIDLIREKVREKFSINLKEEIVRIGEF